jgi:cell division septum initiation protein DivIVA
MDTDDQFDAQVAQRRPGADVEALIRRARDLVETARPAALSTQVKLDRDTLLELLDEAIERMPEEVRAARWLMKDREEFLARTQREADEILAAARGQAERMVQRSEVLKAADAKARRIIEAARAEAGRIRNECDDFCDQRLAQFETVLDRTMRVVATGRAKLRASLPNGGTADAPESPDPAQQDAEAPVEGALFDQDRS